MNIKQYQEKSPHQGRFFVFQPAVTREFTFCAHRAEGGTAGLDKGSVRDRNGRYPPRPSGVFGLPSRFIATGV